MDTMTNAECKPIVEDDRTGLSVETLKRALKSTVPRHEPAEGQQ
jgi:hypothetical protein